MVHFTYLVKEANEYGDFNVTDLALSRFISIYSAWLYMKPERIFIHTNIKATFFSKLDESTHPHFAAIIRLPNLMLQHVELPRRSTKDIEIAGYEAKSDFIRVQALYDHGGVYMDTDVYALRDFSPLRHMGYGAVLAHQHDGRVCTAMMMTVPRGRLFTAFRRLLDKVFSGSWDLHSTTLLQRLAHDFSSAAGNPVMTLPRETFFAGSWNDEDLIKGYSEKADIATNLTDWTTCDPQLTANLDDYEEELLSGKIWPEPSSWDLCQAYAFHGWNSAVYGLLPEKERKHIFDPYPGINLDYLLSGKSFFAAAVWKITQHALKHGYLKRD